MKKQRISNIEQGTAESRSGNKPGHGPRGARLAAKRVRNTDEPMEFTIMADNLPSPEVIAQRLKNVKVTEDQDQSKQAT